LFTGDFGPSTARELDAWVEQGTSGRISEIAGDLASDLLLALNVIYFNGKWNVPFDESLTELRSFTLADRSQITHPRMQRDGDFPYYEDSDCQAVSLNYRNTCLGDSRFSMVVMLPKDSRMPSLLRETNAYRLVHDFDPRPGHLELPQYTFRCDPTISLAMLGLPASLHFDPSRVVSAFAEVPAELKQKVWVCVNEEGTEAAAATFAYAFLSAERPRWLPKRFRMIVDRPFYFLIMDNLTKVIVFMGKVANPAAEPSPQ
jgi:serpin B